MAPLLPFFPQVTLVPQKSYNAENTLVWHSRDSESCSSMITKVCFSFLSCAMNVVFSCWFVDAVLIIQMIMKKEFARNLSKECINIGTFFNFKNTLLMGIFHHVWARTHWMDIDRCNFFNLIKLRLLWRLWQWVCTIWGAFKVKSLNDTVFDFVYLILYKTMLKALIWYADVMWWDQCPRVRFQVGWLECHPSLIMRFDVCLHYIIAPFFYDWHSAHCLEHQHVNSGLLTFNTLFFFFYIINKAVIACYFWKS